MLNLGLLAFAQPWLLVALLALPAIWLLLRVTPPAPRRQRFPALRLLLRLEAEEETPARTPWWLLLLRMVIAALLILAFARPILNPSPPLAGDGPLLLVLDDGWAAAPGWAARRERLDALLDRAQREDRSVLLLRTAPTADGPPRVEVAEPVAAREALAGLRPQPWPVDRGRAAESVAAHPFPAPPTIVWLSDGLADGDDGLAEAARLGEALDRLGPVQVHAEPAEERARLLRALDQQADTLRVELVRARAGHEETVGVRAIGPGGEILGTAEFAFGARDRRAEAAFDLPLDLRNRVARVETVPSRGVGEVVLLDERWRRRAVGLVGAEHAASDQPLLSELYYVQKALAPAAEIHAGGIPELLSAPLSLLVLTDTGRLDEADGERVARWVEEGGVLLRFAGPRLAQATEDPLLPVPLREGDRQLGGALSWSEPLPIASFATDGPFAGLVPNPEATVRRQVLARPGPELREHTFAALADGTPLVTGRRLGKGWLVLFHTTANTSWTSLPLSGLFVDMLKRVLAMAPGAGGVQSGPVRPHALLAADGTLGPAPEHLPPIPMERFASAVAGPEYPPGLYGPAGGNGGESEEVPRVALNLQTAVGDPEPLTLAEFGAVPLPYAGGAEVDLAPHLLTAALMLALADLVIGLVLRGFVPGFGRFATTSAGALLLLVPAVAAAQEAPSMEAALETRLAYVRTGLREVDELSRAGLLGLTRTLARRTSVEPGPPVAVDPATDGLAVFPLLYWPVPPEHPDLEPGTLDRVEEYLKRGGMILFDTKDAGQVFPGQGGGGPGEQRLAELLADLDLPPLQPVPADHVLTRSFYLLQDFPGRWTGQPLWVDQVPPAINDGVSSVIIGAHDWAGAWAEDDYGNELLPVVPGGGQQREMARRFGVNVAMYALTGNYKTDQVHVPALLERLGQ